MDHYRSNKINSNVRISKAALNPFDKHLCIYIAI